MHDLLPKVSISALCVGGGFHLFCRTSLLDWVLRDLSRKLRDHAGGYARDRSYYFFAPPRFFEGLLTNVMIRMEGAGTFKRKIFHKFMDISKRFGPAILDGKPVSLADKLRYGLGELLVYCPLRNTLSLSKVRPLEKSLARRVLNFTAPLG